MRNVSFGINKIVSIALMTAVICVISPFAFVIPMSPVPISLATFAIYIITIILGHKDGTISVIAYVLLGLVGAPVFTGFVGGVGKVLGPTGGYIIGYIFLVFIEGMFVERASKTCPYNVARQNESVVSNLIIFLGMLFGTVVLYLFGSLWLAWQANMSYVVAFTVGVLPFIIGDVIKMIIALFVGIKIRRALIKNNLI